MNQTTKSWLIAKGLGENTAESEEIELFYSDISAKFDTYFFNSGGPAAQSATEAERLFLLESDATVNKPGYLGTRLPGLAKAIANHILFKYTLPSQISGRAFVSKTGSNTDKEGGASWLANRAQFAIEYNQLVARYRASIYGVCNIRARCTVAGTTIEFSGPQMLEIGQQLSIGVNTYTVASITEAGYVYVLSSAPAGPGATWAEYSHDFGVNRIPKGTPEVLSVGY
jgi:hypothetical protein